MKNSLNEFSIVYLLNGKLIFMKISPQELVKALNEIGVLYQENPNSNEYKLIYNAKVVDMAGEKVIVVQHFK